MQCAFITSVLTTVYKSHYMDTSTHSFEGNHRRRYEPYKQPQTLHKLQSDCAKTFKCHVKNELIRIWKNANRKPDSLLWWCKTGREAAWATEQISFVSGFPA